MPLGGFWVRNRAFSLPAQRLEVQGGVRCGVPSDAWAAPRLVPAAELPCVVAMWSLKISRGLGGKKVFAVCQGWGQNGEWVAKHISPIVIQEGAGSWRNCECLEK